ncbi:Os04g0571450 [Oryza sativa Japonica Group]|uniref:Os04g0571450 protein n=1 Tax=Oryza sativa subsp. japonica TaxID=39947 RepID=A0A0P0WDU6_ORYSJ|nr:hypothetical protein EE612_025036 [Oryza sativa]BAS90576.1 Os04g0571450 [Oryza sativa Japonica Group]
MLAASLGRALPRSTPHPVVCGQLPSSHKPRMGSTDAVSATMAGSAVNMLAHTLRTRNANAEAKAPNPKPSTSPTVAARLASSGCPAPSSLLTRVDTPKLSDEGKMYMSDVVWISMPMDATVACGFSSRPHSRIMISYHHHSRQTLTQLGSARLMSSPQPRKLSADRRKPPVRLWTPFKKM